MPPNEDKASRLRFLASRPDVRIRFTKHAREEREKDAIPEIDVLNMLTRCRVTLIEMSGMDETWRAEGTDNNGRRIAAVVVAFEGMGLIRVITCWAGGKKR